MALGVRIKPRAQREIERAAEWWAQNRLAAPGAVRKDVEAAQNKENKRENKRIKEK